MQDAARLTRTPGIGKKTAERLLLELKGKLGADLGTAAGTVSGPDHASDILNALLAFGLLRKRSAYVGQECSGRHRCLGRHQAGPEGAIQELVRPVSHVADPANSRPIGQLSHSSHAVQSTQ